MFKIFDDLRRRLRLDHHPNFTYLAVCFDVELLYPCGVWERLGQLFKHSQCRVSRMLPGSQEIVFGSEVYVFGIDPFADLELHASHFGLRIQHLYGFAFLPNRQDDCGKY